MQTFSPFSKVYKSLKSCSVFVSTSSVEKSILSIDKDDLEKMIDLFSLVDFDFTNSLDEQSSLVVQKLQKNYAECFLIKQQPFENLLQNKHLQTLKTVIKNRQYCHIVYESSEIFYYENVQAFKIVFSDGNFYLALLSEDVAINNGFKFLRIQFIKEIQVQRKTFHKDIKVEFFLKSFQTVFSNYDTKTYEVQIEVDPLVERFFLQKKFLASQKILQKKPKLLLSYEVTNDMEIIPLVKKWLPHLQIISPTKTKKNLQYQLEQYLHNTHD